jgi:uncharacterized protein
LTTTDLANNQQAKPAARQNPLWKRRLATLSRWLHIYLSMFSFGVLLFFAVTGLTLNHQELFSGQQRTSQYNGSVDPKWLQGAADGVKKFEIVEQLRKTRHITGAVSEFRVEDGQCEVTFKGHGYSADAVIDRATGKYDLTENRMGFVAIVNDLHKGRDSGKPWGIVIDLSAILMTLVSLTGLILIFFLFKRRTSGLLVLAAGVLLCYLAYAIWVP